MTSDVFVRHYTAVADASPVPVLLYNVTMYTGVNLLPDAVERLAQHPNIAGIKESGSSADQMRQLVTRTPEEFVVLGGSASMFFDALCAGASGGVLALAALLPDAVVTLRDLVRAGRLDEARKLQTRIAPLARLVGTGHGVPGLKAALDLLGYAGGAPRPPLLPAPPPVVDALRAELSGWEQGTASGFA
jgi:4-hydroxy-2-oxoglutarate aldolase